MTGLPRAAGGATLRGWEPTDVESLVTEANSHAIWRNLTHMFPHPYTGGEAREWIAACREQDPPRDLAIDINGRVAGSCGIQLGRGVSRYTGHVGYWLGERHWNQGIATGVVASLVEYIWETFDVHRLEAEVLAWNPASARVLEKNGFELEGTRGEAIFKDGQLIDEWMYVLFRSEMANP